MSTCFCNSSLFHKSLKEAFENFVNKSVAGSTSAELMASFCDNLLKKVRGRARDVCVVRACVVRAKWGRHVWRKRACVGQICLRWWARGG